jgi:hypothetical protein
MDEEEKVTCSKHGEQDIVEEGSFTGFAGGACYWWLMSCGCYDQDESNDIAAAY